jgi:hypothetical protein
MIDAARDRLIDSAHDLSQGWLRGLVEAACGTPSARASRCLRARTHS